MWIWRHYIYAFVAQYVHVSPDGKAIGFGEKSGTNGGRGGSNSGRAGSKSLANVGSTSTKVMPAGIYGYDTYGGRGFRPPDFDLMFDRGSGIAPPPSPPKKSKNMYLSSFPRKSITARIHGRPAKEPDGLSNAIRRRQSGFHGSRRGF